MTWHKGEIGSTRGWLYWMARILGDINAIQHGPHGIERRVERRLVGKMAGRTLWRLLSNQAMKGGESWRKIVRTIKTA
jgi:hypothetical protein